MRGRIFTKQYAPKMKQQNERSQQRAAKYAKLFPVPKQRPVAPRGWDTVDTSTD